MAKYKRQRWYSAQGQSRMHSHAVERSGGTRRLASLIVLLVMILILIQQTSDVKKVEKVATAIGLLPTPAVSSLQTETAPDAEADTPIMRLDQSGNDASRLEQVTLEAYNPSVQSYQSIWKSLLKKAPTSVVGSVARKLVGNESPEVAENSKVFKWTEVREWYADSNLQLATWSEIEIKNAASVATNPMDPKTESPIPKFIDLFQNYHSWFANSNANESNVPNDAFFRGLRLAVDERLLDLVVDNSPWWSTDRLPFVRSWQRIDLLRELLANKIVVPGHFPLVEVSQLLSSSHSLRGRPIRFDGTIYRVDNRASISEPGFKQFEYEVIWLRPDGLSNQPVCVYAPSTNIDSNIKLEKDSRVTITGSFFKRIAYASQRGADTSPLLLAAYVKPYGPTDNETASNLLPSLRRIALESKMWKPPLDTATPFAIVQSRIEQALESLDDAALEAGFKGMDVFAAIKPILELERLVPEFDLLLQHQSEWPISDVAVVSRFAGVVTQIERISIDPRLELLLEQSYVYHCQIENENNSIQLLCTSVPSDWLKADGTALDTIRQPCGVDGLKVITSTGATLGWSRSLKWKITEQPTHADLAAFTPVISDSYQFLLKNGWDLAWLDRIRELQTDPIKSLSPREIQPFFALMQLAKRIPYSTTRLPVGSPSNERSVADLMEAFRLKKTSPRPVMQRVAMNMRIVRVTRIRVDDPDQAAMLGSDRYYQLDAMADIGNRTYEIKTDKDPIGYHNEYPVTCVSIEIPNWLMDGEQKSESESESSKEQIWYPRKKTTASGWFFRFWSYKTQEISQSLGENQKQIGPLVVLDSLTLGTTTKEENASSNDYSKTINAIAFVIGVSGTIGIWWFVRRSAKPRLRYPGK